MKGRDASLDDKRITDLFLARDESALALTQEEYGAALKRIALAVTGDPELADECLNDALFEAWNRIPPAEPYGYLYAFLARIVRFRAINRMEREHALKRSAVMTELTRELEECLPSAANVQLEAESNEFMRSVNAFLASLPAKKRSIFVRRYWFLDPVKRIAELMGTSEGTVKMTLARLRKKLREHLEKEGFAGDFGRRGSVREGEKNGKR